jgi:hypothetical protein
MVNEPPLSKCRQWGVPFKTEKNEPSAFSFSPLRGGFG